MRTLLVEDLHELVEAGLLLEEVGGGRLGGLFFQGEMHAFVAAILLRMARLDAFNANAEAKPPEMTRIIEGIRFAGDIVMVLAAWFHRPPLIIAGLVLIVIA